jgi:penicillin-binding protein A
MILTDIESFVAIAMITFEDIFGGQVLERIPAALSILYLIAIGVVIFFLISSLRGAFARPDPLEEDLPTGVASRITQAVTNRSLRIWRVVFFVLAFTVFGLHVYWTLIAADTNEQFQNLTYKDSRQRRANVASLRGWMLDRTGTLENALASYEIEGNRGLTRKYRFDSAFSHLLGTERGSAGLERVLYGGSIDPMPSAVEVLTTIRRQEDYSQDVRTTLHGELQRFVAEKMAGKKGAVVVMDPQTGDVLAMYSGPSYKLSEARTQDGYLELEADRRNKPLLNRATREYYVPGSTFKAFTMIAAFRANKQGAIFPSSAGGYLAARGARPIRDSNGGCAAPYGCAPLDLSQAFAVSSNQYFARMAVELGGERLGKTAELLGIGAYDTPAEALRSNLFSDIWNSDNDRLRGALAVERSAMVTGKSASRYDLALQGIGQGYAGQMTPLQMALIISAIGNMDGRLMKPKIEYGIEPRVFSDVLAPFQAARAREIMALVTEGAGGTGGRAFGAVRSAGIRTGGKTGTAEKDVVAFDSSGRMQTVKKRRRGANGKWETYDAPRMVRRVDSWYVSLAPIERPRLAIAVVVESGGYGSVTAGPIAADIVLKARDLGLLRNNGGRR